MIIITKTAKKIDGAWKKISHHDIKSEDDLDGLVIYTSNGRMFKIVEKKKSE